jgi:phosphohistidine phosphatase
MRQLFVMRHAKSSWDDPGLDDHDRPLAPRGQRAVKLLHGYIRTHGIEPSLVLCSTSRRTRETLEGIAPSGEHVIEPGLYAANAAAIIERLRQLPPETGSAMVIGHNPAMQILVMRLAAGTPSGEDDLATVQRKFPTGALATLTFECSWTELAPDAATLTALARPKDLYLAPRA